MKAILFTKYGSSDVLQFGEMEKPVPKDNDVLVRVHAASVNSWDWELMRATPFINRLMFGLLKPKRIKTLGCDVAGLAEAVGKNVKQLQRGDEVFGDLSRCGWGSFAEYVCVPENALTLKPTNLTFEEAATVPQAGLLALQGLRDQGHIKSGQKVLINGAGGGVGSFAVQIAKSFGSEVTGVDSDAKLNMMRSVGADYVIDYRQEDFTKNGEHYDLILDVADYRPVFDCKRALSSNGSYVIAGGSSARILLVMILKPWISSKGGKKIGLLLHEANKGLDFMKELLEDGKVKPVIDRRYSLSETSDAIRYVEEGRAKGKVVVTVA